MMRLPSRLPMSDLLDCTACCIPAFTLRPNRVARISARFAKCRILRRVSAPDLGANRSPSPAPMTAPRWLREGQRWGCVSPVAGTLLADEEGDADGG